MESFILRALKFNSWDPVEDLAKKLSVLQDGRQCSISNYENIVQEITFAKYPFMELYDYF